VREEEGRATGNGKERAHTTSYSLFRFMVTTFAPFKLGQGGVMRPITTLMTCLVLIAFAAAPAFSAPHYQSGPTCVAGNNTVTCVGDIAGLGNDNIDVVVEASGTTTCQNRGSKPPEGQEPPGLDTTATGEESDIRVKNGRATYSVTAVAANPCPDRMIATTTFTSVTVTVFQPSGSDNVILEDTLSL
jgi:hypothetical protein